MIDIGGRSLHLVSAGEAGASPAAVLEAGSFGLSADWAVVQSRLAATGLRSHAYDRAGLGSSDPGPSPRDGLAVARDLETLLAALGDPGPFILVGHSMAGLHVRLFAQRNPTVVAGLVLVDAVTPEASETLEAKRWVGRFSQLSQAASAVAGLGLFAPFTGTPVADSIGLSGEAAAEKRRAFGSAAHNRWAADEVAHWNDAAGQALAAGALDPDWPVAVVTAGLTPARGDWRTAQVKPARDARQSYVHNVDRAGHANLLGPVFADEIVKAILFVRDAGARR
jgi:pimeloyl-ACP methyl ester carboxylesterase